MIPPPESFYVTTKNQNFDPWQNQQKQLGREKHFLLCLELISFLWPNLIRGEREREKEEDVKVNSSLRGSRSDKGWILFTVMPFLRVKDLS